MEYDAGTFQERSARILVVDDEPMNIRIMKTPLQQEGYEVLVATNGAEGLQLARTERPDLILLDILMPELDGYAVCRQLREDPALREVPVIFVTALGSEEEEARGFRLGAVDYVTKPISVPRLKVRVRNQLQMQGMLHHLEDRNRMLEEMARLREQVEQITRHDLKTPLNTIIGFTTVLESEVDCADEHRSILSSIRHAGYRMLDMINRSLDLYKIESGVYAFDPTPVDLVALFGQLEMRGGGFTLRLLVDGRAATTGDTALVRGDEGLCFTLFGNLLKNAQEALGDSGGTITVNLWQGEQDLEVAVNNPGVVPEAILERFFEKFVTHGKTKGTGLGTYSARLMVQVQDGDVAVCSSPERGTAVAVRLPSWVSSEPRAGRIVFDTADAG